MTESHIVQGGVDVQQAANGRELLEAYGDLVRRDLHGWTPDTYNYESAADTVALGCDVAILIWGVAASQSKSVWRPLHLAEQLLRPIIDTGLDFCSPPDVSIAAVFPEAPTIMGALLDWRSRYEPDRLVQSTVRLLAHESLSARQQEIEQLRQLLDSTSHRAVALALLEHMVNYELVIALRRLALEIPDDDRILRKRECDELVP